MVKPKGKLAALPDLLSLELSLVVILGFLSGLVLASGISLLKDFGAIFAPALVLAFLSFGFNAFNAVFDMYLDTINRPKRPLPSGAYSPNQAFIISVFFFLSAVLMALEFSSAFYITVFAFIFLAVVYSLPPLYLKGVAYLGTVISSFIYGVVPVLAGIALFAPASYSSFLPYLLITFLFALSAVSLKDFETYMGDSMYSVRTFPVMFGKNTAVQVSALLLVLPYLVIAIFAAAGIFRISAFLVAMLGFWAIMSAKAFAGNPSTENSKIVLSQTMLLSLLSSLLLALIIAA